MPLVTLLVFLLLCVTGCEPSKQEPAATAEGAKTQPAASAASAPLIFNQPTEPQLLELPSEALSHWRVAADNKPALLLLSYDPLLKPLDATVRDAARQLAQNGSATELRQQGSINTAQPLILPTQAISAALDAGLISKLYWVFPAKTDPTQLDLDKFREQLLGQQFLSTEEATSLTLKDGVFSGTLRGVPFAAIHYQKLQKIAEPLLLHIDLSYFRGRYDNEIKTPLYTLLRETVDSLRELKLQPLVTTLSYSTLEGFNSLDVRFLISNLAELLKNPALLEQDIPTEWALRSEALYASDLYTAEKKTELSERLLKTAPQSAAAFYDRFQLLFLQQQLEPALQALQQAVELDAGYAAAYIQLAQMAIEDNQLQTAIELLDQAAPRYPENPFIPLQKAHLMTYLGQTQSATEQLGRLPESWSPLHHQQVPEVIATLKIELAQPNPAEKQRDAKP